ncbi:MAG TPA: beta-L-arabinofuranosidase domain-containing protein [Terriglobia bacterium]|nr:beta-L-arabinofuranosidase domain-containing protein [Terriglobia bacterium]
MSTRRRFIQLATAAASGAVWPASTFAEARNPSVRAVEEKLIKASPVPLGKVRILGGPLKAAQDRTADYLLQLEPDRMMAYYRIRAGLPEKAQPYGGWDGGGRNLTGHIAGHYLSAVSLMFRATGDARFKDRADYLVSELQAAQDAQGDGYLGALENGREAFAALSSGQIRAGGFDLNGLWSPWYVLHKTFAGLRDAYRYAGNATALDVEIRFASWAERALAPLSEAQVQRMLNTEFGGMNEALADLYADTGDKRWLDLSYRFEHRAFTGQLKRHQDNLSGKHGNCQIPKLIGSAARYGYTGDVEDLLAAAFFWDRVTGHHSYATGGHGLEEYFGAPDQLSARVDGRTAETCNVYNMLKLTRRLFALRPDAAYVDFQERALFNHILASMDPADGRMSYMVPVGRGVQQEYQDMMRSFTCCVGSGMESHALHGDGLYFESAGRLWVNLFVPSTAEFGPDGSRLKMDTGFPDGDTATLSLTLPAPRELTIAVRRPVWAGDGFAIRVNGVVVEQALLATLRGGAAGGRGNAAGNEGESRQASSYVELKRRWTTGDTIELSLPKSLQLEPTPDNASVSAILWGPLVLAGDMGPRREGRGASSTPVPVLVAAGKPLSEWIQPNPARAGDFDARQVARLTSSSGAPPIDLAFRPFYRTHRRRYSVYFDVLSPAEFEARSGKE